MANHINQEGPFPEPSSIKEYQDELLRAWGIVLRLDTYASKVLEEAKASQIALEKLAKACETMKAIIQAGKR